jgi:ubiquitin-protein ligase
MSDAKWRLLRDFKTLQSENSQQFTAAPDADNILKRSAVIFGPDDTD